MKAFKKKKIICAMTACLAVIIAISSSMCGCSDEENNTSEWDISENHIKKTYSDNFIVDADIPESYNNKANVLVAKTMQFDEDAVKSVFFKGRTFTKYAEDGSTFYSDTKSTDEDPNNEYNYALLSISPDTSDLNFSCLEFQYDEFAEYFFRTSYEYIDDMIKYSDTFQKDELDFMSKEDALAAVSAELKKLNVDVPDSAEVYALDYESLQSVWDENRSALESYTMNTKEEKTFKQDNECYAVCFRCAFDGVPVTHDSYIFKENSTYVTGSNIKVYYSKNGVIGMKWNGWYDVQETAESPDSLITVQDALDKAYEDFNSMQDSSKQIVIKEARFEYAVIPNVENTDEFNLVPSWSLIYSIKSDNSSDTVTNMLHVNAATGEIINTPYWQLKK